MCLILLAWQGHPDHPLVVAANRDEFFARPTAAVDFWTDAPQVLAGRDLQAGGTWMGITREGRFAALTNFRDPSQNATGAPSRGHLVADFLRGTESPTDYLDRIDDLSSRCNGFNLLLGNRNELWCHSNMADNGGKRKLLAPGVYGVSNHLLDTPWPKVGAGKMALSAAITALPDERPLFQLLDDDTVHPDQALPATGVPLEWERLLSSAFVKSPAYGTRSSSVVTVSSNGVATFDEQTWLAGAVRGPRRRFRFTTN